MGRMHSKGKGMSSSALPYKRSAPSWCKTTAAEVKESICKLARKGATPSQIGVLLRDSNGIPQVRRCSLALVGPVGPQLGCAGGFWREGASMHASAWSLHAPGPTRLPHPA